jgi:hypothetical protein
MSYKRRHEYCSREQGNGKAEARELFHRRKEESLIKKKPLSCALETLKARIRSLEPVKEPGWGWG